MIVFLVWPCLNMPDLAPLFKLIVECCDLFYLSPQTQLSLFNSSHMDIIVSQHVVSELLLLLTAHYKTAAHNCI